MNDLNDQHHGVLRGPSGAPGLRSATRPQAGARGPENPLNYWDSGWRRAPVRYRAWCGARRLGSLIVAASGPSAINADGKGGDFNAGPNARIGAGAALQPMIVADTTGTIGSPRSVPALARAPAPAAPPMVAAPPCTNPNAMGVSRVVEIDTTGGPGFGSQHFKSYDFLNDHEVVLTFDDGPWLGHTPAVLKALCRSMRARDVLLHRQARDLLP